MTTSFGGLYVSRSTTAAGWRHPPSATMSSPDWVGRWCRRQRRNWRPRRIWRQRRQWRQRRHGGDAGGGGLFIRAGALTIYNSTIADNYRLWWWCRIRRRGRRRGSGFVRHDGAVFRAYGGPGGYGGYGPAGNGAQWGRRPIRQLRAIWRFRFRLVAAARAVAPSVAASTSRAAPSPSITPRSPSTASGGPNGFGDGVIQVGGTVAMYNSLFAGNPSGGGVGGTD